MRSRTAYAALPFALLALLALAAGCDRTRPQAPRSIAQPSARSAALSAAPSGTASPAPGASPSPPAATSGLTLPSDAVPVGPSADPFTALHVSARSSARWTAMPPPPPLVPPQPTGVYVLSASVLVAAAADGLWRSTDAGTSWQRTLALDAGQSASGIWRAGDGLVAAIDGPAAVAGPPADQAVPRVTLFVSDDGLHWHSVTPLLGSGGPAPLDGDSLVLDSTGPDAVGFAFPDTRLITVSQGQLLRTADGGRHWAAVAGLAHVTDVDFAPGSDAVWAASNSAGSSDLSCQGRLVRSGDRGRTWAPVPASCADDQVWAVDFVNQQDGFEVGGSPNHYGGSQYVAATTDGGRTWTRRFHTTPTGQGGPAWPDGFAQAAFTSSTDGYALSGACVGSGDGPCGGGLWHTADGGRTWHDTGQRGNDVTATAGLVAVTGRRWQAVGGLGISTDDGAEWRRVSAPTDVDVRQLSPYTGGLFADLDDTDGATSTDDGRTWQPVPIAEHGNFSNAVVRLGSRGLVTDSDALRVLGWSDDRGATITASTGGPDTIEGVQDVEPDPSDDRRLLALGSENACSSRVFLSKDGGRSWAAGGRLPLMGGLSGPMQLGLDGHTVVATGSCGDRQAIAISQDDGATWSMQPFGQGYALTAAGVADGTIWVAGSDGHRNVVVLVSSDGGATWAVHELHGIAARLSGDVGIAALSGRQALLTLGDSTLWRTTDAGASWQQERPAL